jgi:hypothetical protein
VRFQLLRNLAIQPIAPKYICNARPQGHLTPS